MLHSGVMVLWHGDNPYMSGNGKYDIQWCATELTGTVVTSY